jgi:sugar phosphate isomerase/epimerase
MRIGIFAKTFPGSSPFEVLKAAAGAGYQSVQYNMACSGLGSLPDRISDDAADAVRDAARAAGVGIAAISATYNMIHPSLAIRQAGRRSFEAIASQADRIGSRLLTICTGSRDPDDQWRHHPDNGTDMAWSELLEEFGHLIAIANRFDIRIGVEPELANVVNSAQKARALLDAMGSARIRIVFDPANLFEQEGADERRRIIETAADLLADRIEIVHAKDRDAEGRFVTAGQGLIDYVHYFATLRRVGFDGDVITHGLDADEAAGVAEFLQSAWDARGP